MPKLSGRPVRGATGCSEGCDMMAVARIACVNSVTTRPDKGIGSSSVEMELSTLAAEVLDERAMEVASVMIGRLDGSSASSDSACEGLSSL